jgi:hypothetical protein
MEHFQRITGMSAQVIAFLQKCPIETVAARRPVI